MDIIICGAGRVGFNLARYLSRHNHEITMIDSSLQLISSLNDRLEVKALCGHASSPEVLRKAGIETADMVIAVTRSDEVNMVICEVAHALFGVKTKIARIRHHDFLDPRWVSLFHPHHLSIDFIISPEIEVAQAISTSLQIPGALEIISLSENKIKVLTIRCVKETPVINTPISHFTTLFPDLEISVVGMMRGDTQWIPDEKDIFLEGDKLYFACAAPHVSYAMMAFGHEGESSGNILILGGGNIGLKLAQEIEASSFRRRAVVIEKDSERAAEVAEILSDTIVLCGDALDKEVLLEAGVQSAHTVVAVTADDRVNALSALLAKRQGAKHVSSLINSGSFESLVSSLGVDAVINPRKVTVSKILQYINREKFHSVYSLGSQFGELMEIDTMEASAFVGLSAQDVNVSKSVRLVAILRDGGVYMEKRSLTIAHGDRLLLMVAPAAQSRIEKMLTSWA